MKMTKSLFSETDCLLLLGEGNFSFALHLSTSFNCKIIATDVTTDRTADPLTLDNCNQLIKSGHKIHFGIDATKLEEYCELKANQDINHIIFNFPQVLTKKMKIGLNRDLLKSFFESASNFIGKRKDIKVMISLCGGQSGVNAVETADKQRLWSDSWQLPAMAAYGRFVITGYADFAFDYRLFGYRLKNIEFNSSDAKTFTLEKRDEINSCGNYSKFHSRNENLFSNHLVVSLIEDLKSKTKLVLFNDVEIDYETTYYPFITHWLIIRFDSETFSKLNQYMNSTLIIDGQKIYSTDTRIGKMSNIERVFGEYPPVCDPSISLCVEQLVRLKYGITDSRILWSKYLRLAEEVNHYTTGSMFFREHIHDISFWIDNNDCLDLFGKSYHYHRLLSTVLDVFGVQVLKRIQLIDTFVSDNKTSKCYRLVYESVDRGLSQQKCNEMQNTVRDLLIQRHGFSLR